MFIWTQQKKDSDFVKSKAYKIWKGLLQEKSLNELQLKKLFI